MTVTLAAGQRVEVARTAYGVATFELATVVDFPNEDSHVRVLFDAHVERGTSAARVVDRADVLSIPEAVSRHITRLIAALGSVGVDEAPAVEDELHRRLMTHSRLIDFARDVADQSASVAAAVKGLS
jgi:hypothetical protein